jgi:alpha-L-fucosidase
MKRLVLRASSTLALLVLAVAASVAWAQAPMVTDDGAAARIAWWRDAKFGLFIHWGLYAIPGRGEWVQWNEQIPVDEYAKLATQFTADKFDADAWAATAKAAGMKYTVMVTRHHDGFAMFDDPGNDYTAMKSAAHRDFVAAYVTAARKAGLRIGLYYSPLDWRFPGYYFPDLYRPSAIQMRDQYHRQLNELASNYGKIDILWFDGGGESWLGFGGVQFKGGQWSGRPRGQIYSGSFSWQDDQAIANLKKLQPSVIINNRTDAPADFRDREGDKALGDFDNQHPWELCTTMAGGVWGYKPNGKVKTRDETIRLLVSVVGRDGNLLLNVGPRPDGQIDPEQVQVLRDVGDWLKLYGQSIYATRGGPYLPGDYGVSTFHDKTVYLHILHATGKTLSLPALPAKILSCSSLTGGDANCTQTGSSVEVTLSGNPETVDTIVALTLASPATGINPIATPLATKPVSAAVGSGL